MTRKGRDEGWGCLRSRRRLRAGWLKGSRRRLQSPIRAGKNYSIPSDPQVDRHQKIRESRRSSRPWGCLRVDFQHGRFPCASIHARISAEFGRAVSDDPCGVLLRPSSRGGIGLCGADVSNGCWATFWSSRVNNSTCTLRVRVKAVRSFYGNKTRN